MASGSNRGFVLADFNDDGWLDIAKRDVRGPNKLYMSRCGESAWLRVQLRMPGANTRAVGGRVILEADDNLNTVVDYRFVRTYRAANGAAGQGRNCTGKSGEDLVLHVSVGTTILDEDTGEILGDLSAAGEQLLVAQGGFHGLGNTRFKSSTNRAPHQSSNKAANSSSNYTTH